MADDLKEKLFRTVRANLNRLQDRIKELDEGFETIGAGGAPHPRYSDQKTLREYYANLEVEYLADMDTVKAAYRNLMRKYHPDKYTSDPSMEALSTQISQELTRAYQAIESYWKSGKF